MREVLKGYSDLFLYGVKLAFGASWSKIACTRMVLGRNRIWEKRWQQARRVLDRDRPTFYRHPQTPRARPRPFVLPKARRMLQHVPHLQHQFGLPSIGER
jgi:hypothetical protein